jgi:hypothetical protein
VAGLVASRLAFPFSSTSTAVATPGPPSRPSPKS